MYNSNSCFHLFQLSAKFVTSKSNWAGGLSCVILSVVPAFALACCPSVGVVGFFRTVSVYPVLTPDTMFSWEGIVLISVAKCYINWLVITNIRPFSLNTQTRLLLNNVYCYIDYNFCRDSVPTLSAYFVNSIVREYVVRTTWRTQRT